MKQLVFLAVTLLFIFSTSASAQQSAKAEGIHFSLTSVKVLADTLFFHFKLNNRSLLRYHLAGIRMYTQERLSPKRTAVQQNDQEPLGSPRLQTLDARSSVQLVIPYPAFTVSNSKNLLIQAAESGYTRMLLLKISGRHFRRLIRKY